MKRLSFRTKVVLSYILVFLLFLALIIPFANRSAASLMYGVMEERANELISILTKAPNELILIEMIKDQKPNLFYRATLINAKQKVIYDSHTKRIADYESQDPVHQEEVLEALENGIGYNEEYSNLLKQDFAYLAKTFDFHGQKFVIRISFPKRYVLQITSQFRIGFVLLSTLVLLLYSLMTWFILNHFTKPIQQIIRTILPYQAQEVDTLPAIKLSKSSDEFDKLADTLNLLSQRVQHQIDNLISEKNEKIAILESLTEGVVAVDRKGVITYANEQAKKIFGESLPVGEGSWEDPSKFHATALLKQAIQEKKSLSELASLDSPGGKKFYLLVAVPLIGDNSSILVVQDQTSQFAMVEMRREFVANASHELKTPLTIIQGFAETLHDSKELSQEQIESMTARIVKNCERMTKMIQQLLTLADIDELPSSRQLPCSLKPLLEKCRELMLEKDPAAQIIIRLPDSQDFTIIADPDLLERAFLNLLDNSVKYSNPPAKIEITAKASEREIEIEFKDHGIGIGPEDLANVFTRFYRASTVRTKKSGSGLGLSIVETIIRKHRGKISVSSKLGEGSCFTITLPLGEV